MIISIFDKFLIKKAVDRGSNKEAVIKMGVLTGKTILVTRPREQADETRLLLEKEGARVLLQPTVEIVPLDIAEKQSLLNSVCSDFRCYDWLLFSSANGVKYFFDLLNLNTGNHNNKGNHYNNKGNHYNNKGDHYNKEEYCGKDSHPANGYGYLFDLLNDKSLKVAVVGSGTGQILRQYGVVPQLIPEEFRAEGLITALKAEGVGGKHILSIRGDRGRNVLKTELTKMGALFQEIAVYHSRDVEQADPDIQYALKNGAINGIIVTSSAIAESLVRLFQADLKNSDLFALSSLTSSVLINHGFHLAAEAETATMADLVKAVVRYYSREIP